MEHYQPNLLSFSSLTPLLFEEVSKLLSEWSDVLRFSQIENCHVNDESHENDPEKIVEKRILPRFFEENCTCITEESQLIVGGKQFLSTVFKDDSTIERFAREYEGQEALGVVVVGYTNDGKTVHKYRGELAGKVVLPRGEFGFGFDKIWCPSGYGKTLSEMYSYKFLVSMRHKPYIALANSLRRYTFHGLFEMHVTVRSPTNLDVDELVKFQEKFKCTCKQANVKPVLIELPNGTFPTQLMTASYFHGDMSSVHLESFHISQLFAMAGFDIVRTKIEAMCSSKGVPETDEEALKMSKGNYFEFHVKLDLTPTQASDLSILKEICTQHNAHLSKNALKLIENGHQHRFVTMRMYLVGKQNAMAQFDSCVTALENGGFKVVTRQREYSVYDSNVNLDAGWMEQTKNKQLAS